MPYNLVVYSLYTTKLYTVGLVGRLSSSKVRFYAEHGRFAFEPPPLWGLGATYDV